MSKKYARAIMEFLSAYELKTNHGVTLQSPRTQLRRRGMSYEDVQTGLIEASMRGWIILVDEQYVHLTEVGYVIINIANDHDGGPHFQKGRCNQQRNLSSRRL